MGVIYKLKDEVVQFIISQRQGNPLSSCRQLAESASQKFGLHLSKSSVHDVLKESGISTPRGRKPKEKFEIPLEKKKQIQVSLSQVKLLPAPAGFDPVILSAAQDLKTDLDSSALPQNDKQKEVSTLSLIPDVTETAQKIEESLPVEKQEDSQETEVSAEYEGAGRIFLKAVLWDLGLLSEENIKQSDWDYYLTYTKGIKVLLENNAQFFIELPLPIERCIREATDGLINNIKPFIVHQVSDEALFKATMEARVGHKIQKVSIVDHDNHEIVEIIHIVEYKRNFIRENRIFVENNKNSIVERLKSIFFPQTTDNNELVENILNLRGYEASSKDESTVSLFIEDGYINKAALQEAAEKLNRMYLRDEENRLVKVKIEVSG